MRKETTPTAIPPYFDNWCRRFDDIFTHKAQKAGFRHYWGGLWGESEGKNLTQLSKDTVGVTYHRGSALKERIKKSTEFK